MKKLFKETDAYLLEVDLQKNRAYLSILGFWRRPEDVKDYLDDFRQAVRQLKPGFTLLTDLRKMKTHPPALAAVHNDAQHMLMEEGLAQTAEVIQSSLVKFQTGTYSKSTSMPLKQFHDAQEAEVYLDAFIGEG